MRSIVFVAPFPLDATMRFARAVARLPNVRLIGVFQEVPRPEDRRYFADVVTIRNGLSTREIVQAVDVIARRYGKPDRIVGVLEILQVQLAQVRAHFGIPGTDPDTADLFRDKARMKDRLRAANLPVARHALLTTAAEARAFAERVGFPMVLKPPAGQGAKATFRVTSLDQLMGALQGMHAGPNNPMLAEEFLLGDEGSFDTITVNGRPRVFSISRYLPTPLTVLENPWIQWTCLLPKEQDTPEYAEVIEVGTRAIKALGLQNGFTHMEWFRRPDGSIAIGEIAQRPPGANITRMIGLTFDVDPYLAWARAVVDYTFDGPWERKYSAGCAFFRGIGKGRVSHVTGVQKAQDAVGKWVVEAKLPAIGAPKSDSYEGDGYAIVRHPETAAVHAALKTLIENVHVHYA